MIQTDTEKTSRIKPWGFSVGKKTNGEGAYREVLHILTCVHKLAPIASQGSALPPREGAADAKEKRIHSFYMS